MAMVPDRKISETILDFAEPVIGPVIGSNPPIAALTSMFQIIITIWNAHVMATPIWGQPDILAEVRRTIAGPGAPPELRIMFKLLSDRRLELFGTDYRAVGEWSVIADKGTGFKLRCDARMPRTKT